MERGRVKDPLTHVYFSFSFLNILLYSKMSRKCFHSLSCHLECLGVLDNGSHTDLRPRIPLSDFFPGQEAERHDYGPHALSPCSLSVCFCHPECLRLTDALTPGGRSEIIPWLAIIMTVADFWPSAITWCWILSWWFWVLSQTVKSLIAFTHFLKMGFYRLLGKIDHIQLAAGRRESAHANWT